MVGYGKRPASGTDNEHRSPEELHGILSRVFFTWIHPILLHGYNNILVDQDLPPLGRGMKPEVTRKAILQTWAQRAKPESKMTLPLALMNSAKIPFFAAAVPRLFLIAFRYSRPILIKESIRYLQAPLPRTDDVAESYGYWLVISAVIIYVGLAVSTSIYEHCMNKLKLMTRSALVGVVHDKIMKSSSIAYDNGEVTTLMSTDVDSLDGIAEMIHETWAQVIEVMIGMGLLASQVGWIWPLPLFLIYLCSHMSRFVAKNLHPRQRSWNKATQDRIAATSSMLSAMKMVKMLGIQQYLNRRIQELRNEELWVASKLRWIMVYYNASANALGMFTPAITLVIFAVLSGLHSRNLDTETAFTTMAILGMVTHPANMVMTFVPRAVGAFAGFERIQAFLLRPSLQDHRNTLPTARSNNISQDLAPDYSKKPDSAIQICQLIIGNEKPILKDMNIEIAAGSLTVISGPTGSGKSTLIRAILGEVAPSRGFVCLSTQRIGYCAQKPWLPSGTIREAIYGATKIDGATDEDHESFYDEVIEICCLRYDIDALPDGDQTQIGSKGLNLSGGQRQRVTLARALFARYDLLLLDDTFSGLDGDTEHIIFKNLFDSTGLIRQLKTTVVLVSNSTQYFQAADHIVVLGNHGILDQGKWEDIKIRAESIARFSPGHHNRYNAGLSKDFDKLGAQFRAKDEAEADLARQSGDSALYGYYFSFVGFNNLFLLLILTASCAFFMTIPQYWLQLWTESSVRHSMFYILGFLLFSIMSWASTSCQMWSVLIRLAPQSGMRLHQRLLDIVTNAPLSYFSKTDTGSVLNRFSQDIQLIDKQLPSALQTIITQILKLVMQIIMLYVAQKALILFVPPSVLFVYLLQNVYLRTSRQLRFLELERQAGVFSNFLESVEGLETIRSFGWSKSVIQDNILQIDNFQRSQFLLLCLQRWLHIILDLLAATVPICAVAIAVAFPGYVSGAQLGIALNILLVTSTTLLKLVENWTTLEMSLGAIARLRSLEKTTPFEGGMSWNLEPPEDWPSKGHVEFKDITAAYQPESVALQNLSLNIEAGQKLIVCGRTGSGKSTLLLTLLRILELQSGKIEIDGIDIKQVRLDILRQRCFIAVSQDPLLLSNETLRFNLDPRVSVSDDIIVETLRNAGLWSHFLTDNMLSGDVAYAKNSSVSGDHLILDKKMLMTQELSVGQCQLFALCRALIKVHTLRRSGLKPVILLDEVTSSLDPATESTIHRSLDNEFTGKGHTVIIVAHRLGSLKNYVKIGRDAVALMADGKLQKVIKDLKPANFELLGGI